MNTDSVINIPVEISDNDWALINKSDNPLYHYKDIINEICQKGLKADINELLAWCIFKDWDDSSDWYNIKQVRKKLPDYAGRFNSFFDFSENTIQYKRTPEKDITEFMGVGASLKLATEIFQCTNADFRKLSDYQRSRINKSDKAIKVLDYETTVIGSDGKQVLEIESKGTHDNASKYDQIKHIREKKTAQKDENPNNIRFGSVLSIKYEDAKQTQLYFIDPPSEIENVDPKYIRLINRLHYYRKWLGLITEGHLSLALSNRINILEYLPDEEHTKLNNIPLVSSRMDPLIIYEQMAEPLQLSQYDIAHGRIVDLRISSEMLSEVQNLNRGEREILKIPHKLMESEPRLFFYGLHKNVLRTLIKQNFEDICRMDYSFKELSNNSKDFDKDQMTIWSSGLVTGMIKCPDWNSKRLPLLLRKLLKM